MNTNFTQKIYLSLIAYESSIILGSLAKLYFSVGNLNPKDYDIIKEVFTKLKSDHVKTNNLKKVAKAIKGCLLKGIEVNYENLETLPEFKQVFKDKNSFINHIQNQQLPTYDDLKIYLQTLDHATSDIPTIDVALKNQSISNTNPEFGEFLQSINEITEAIKKSEEQDDFKSGEEVMIDYEQIEAKRLAGEGFYTCGFQSIDKYLTEGLAPKQVTIVAARPGMGKCLGKGTKVLLYSGDLINVEDVKVGDLLMGPDSKPRKVLGTTQGRELLYRVDQKSGISYRVNGAHVLSLKKSRKEGSGEQGSVLNISVNEWLKKSKKFQSNYKGYKVSVEYPEKELLIDPYILGLWLGDGSTGRPKITNVDPEVIDAIYSFADANNFRVNNYQEDYSIVAKTRSESKNFPEKTFKAMLRTIGVLGNKNIPRDYLINSYENRLKLLAGLLDSDGYYFRDGKIYEITLSNESLLMQIKHLCDSLGFKVTVATKRASIKTIGYDSEAYRLVISGDIDKIPCKISRKKAEARKAIANHRHSGISVTPDKVDDYYGFELDGDHLFLLEDMTVTHNSALCIGMMRNLSKQGIPAAQFVLEMDSISYIDRYISIDGMIDLETLVKYPETLTDEQKIVKESVKDGVKKNKYLYLRDKPSPSIKEIREKIIKLQERIGSKYIVVFIDLFDKIKNVTSKSDNLTGSFHISLNDLQTLAKELGVHFVLVAQINRESEKSQSKRPGLQNLKHSGAFEEVADLIIFIDRPSYRMLEEEIAEIDNAYQPAKYIDGFNYESLDTFVKKYDSEVFENITSDTNLDAALQESISSASIKDSGGLDSKLKESGMVKVGNIVIPVKEYAEVIIAKQRRGVANKIIPFIYKGQYSMFTSVSLVSPFSSGDKSV